MSMSVVSVASARKSGKMLLQSLSSLLFARLTFPLTVSRLDASKQDVRDAVQCADRGS
jgi:hypothetical protein